MTGEEQSEMHLLDEVWQTDACFDGSLYCPGCGNILCSLGWSGELKAFEAACPSCGADLFSQSTIAASNEYYRENGEPSLDEMKEYVKSYWSSIIKNGKSAKIPKGYEQDGVISEGEYEGFPQVVPVMEPVDVTEDFIRQFKHYAEQFSWDWDVSEHSE